MSQTRSNTSPLQRGTACVHCRTRKVKCDGNRPACGPCMRRGGDCRFDGELAQSQQLERQIDSLKSRLGALESTSSSTSLSLASCPLPDGWWDFEEPPVSLRRLLLDTFFLYSSTTAFFLNVPRFIRSFSASAPIGHQDRPSPALLNAVYLWGIALSQEPRLQPYEPVYLSRAINHSQRALLGDHPQKGIHTIQAEILLSLYFFQAGHISEGISHSNAAVSIVLAYGYHQIHDVQSLSALFVGVDVVAEGEIINAFWATYLVDKSWATAADFVSAFPDEMMEEGRIDTPWPLDMAQYESGIMQLYGQGTIRRFLDNPSASYANEDASFFAMHCKAVVLFERATILTSSLKNNMDSEEFAPIYEQFLVLNQGIEKFRTTVAPINPATAQPNSVRTLIVVHSLALAAVINLNSMRYIQQNHSWRDKRVAAAIGLATFLDDVHLDRLGYVDSIMGNLWFRAGEVLISECTRLAALQDTTSSSQEQLLRKTLDRLMDIMNVFTARSSNISSQYIALRHARPENM